MIESQLVNDGKAFDTNLRIEVKLTVRGGQGRKSSDKTTEKKV